LPLFYGGILLLSQKNKYQIIIIRKKLKVLMMNIKKSFYPIAIVAAGALLTHFLPHFVKPEKKDVELIPETQRWKE
jgi:hypothetical protein